MQTLKTTEITSLLNIVLNETGRLRTGDNLQYHCPQCHHRKRKFEVCLVEPYKWNCWVCSFKGRGLHRLFTRLNAPKELYHTLDNLVGMRDSGTNPNISFSDQIHQSLEGGEKMEVAENLKSLPPGFRSLAENDRTIEYKIAMAYAKKRNITFDDIIKYNIGYCTKGKYANRLVFPSYDADNRLNFYSCRSYYDDGLKYSNAEFDRNIVGFENLVDFGFPIYLCEGALDAISIRRNAVPLFGKTLSGKLKSAIIASDCPEVNIVLDDDALNSALRIARWVTSVGKTPKIVRLEGHDPNQIGFSNTMAQIKKTNVLDFSHLIKLRLE